MGKSDIRVPSAAAALLLHCRSWPAHRFSLRARAPTLPARLQHSAQINLCPCRITRGQKCFGSSEKCLHSPSPAFRICEAWGGSFSLSGLARRIALQTACNKTRCLGSSLRTCIRNRTPYFGTKDEPEQNSAKNSLPGCSSASRHFSSFNKQATSGLSDCCGFESNALWLSSWAPYCVQLTEYPDILCLCPQRIVLPRMLKNREGFVFVEHKRLHVRAMPSMISPTTIIA